MYVEKIDLIVFLKPKNLVTMGKVNFKIQEKHLSEFKKLS